MWSREIDEMGMINQTQKGDQCQRIIKITLFSILGFIFVGAIAILGIGIWTHEVEYGSKQLAALVGVKIYQVDSVIMIVCGTATICMTIAGLLGILIPNKCLMGLHISVQTFLAFALFAAGILGYVFASSLEDSVTGAMKKSVVEKYGVPGYESVTKQWDVVQKRFSCCGASGDVNTTTSWALYKEESFWHTDHYANGSFVPQSCCKDGNIGLCTGKMSYTENWPPRVGPPVYQLSTDYTLYTTGCYDKLKDYLTQNGVLIGTAAVVVGVFMIVELVLSICIYRQIH